ncbi:TPA: hypothetical protein SFZ51_001766 [Campylobacter jejuni]|nr:hypothetical protein [Campylobacter jejuni]HEG8105031.1 hypothetical protein [Campylobacter jejuni]HEG8134106.1 hypothetical protein [Campylobacter jejuni]
MSRNAYILNGTSGVGKGTRVLQLMMFLENYLALQPKLLVMTGSKDRIIGRHYPDLDFTVAGKFTFNRINKKVSWSGWNSIAHNNNVYDKLEILGQEMNVLVPDLVRYLLRNWGSHWTIEGYPKVTPTAYSLWGSFDKIYDTYYVYDDVATEAAERCRIRTGVTSSSKANVDGQGMALRNVFTQVDRAKMIKDIDTSNYFREKLSANSPLHSWGNIFLDSVGMSELIPMFEKFCEENQYHRRHDMDNVLDLNDKYKNQSELDRIVVDYRDTVKDGLIFRTKQGSETATWRVVRDGKLETANINFFGIYRKDMPNLIQWKKELKEKGLVYEDGEYRSIKEEK